MDWSRGLTLIGTGVGSDWDPVSTPRDPGPCPSCEVTLLTERSGAAAVAESQVGAPWRVHAAAVATAGP